MFPRASEVNELDPINIPKVAALAPRDEEGCSAYSLEGSYWRINALGIKV